MKNSILFNSTITTNTETTTWTNYISENWPEIVSNGMFTLLGTGIGAFLAGKYAINAVKKEIKYNHQNKYIEKADNSLIILISFIHNITFSVNKSQKNKELFTKYKNNKEPYKHVLSESLEDLVATINIDLEELKKIQLHQSSPEDYNTYILIIEILNILNMNSKTLYHLLNNINTRQELYENEVYLDLIKYTDQLIKHDKELSEKENTLNKKRLKVINNLEKMTS